METSAPHPKLEDAASSPPAHPAPPDPLTRAAALLALLAGGLALGLAGLIAPPVCLLTLLLLLLVGFGVPRWWPALMAESPQRTAAAVAALGLLVGATAGSGPGALGTGGLRGGLGAAARELALPSQVPIGLLAALAAGALVAVALELGDRRGLQSGLVLSLSVIGLTSVATPTQALLPAFALGWPAGLFALTRVVPLGSAGPVATRLVPMVARSGEPRVSLRWQVLPALGALALAGCLLAAAVLGGLATLGDRSEGWDGRSGAAGGGSGRSAGDYLGGSLDLTSRGPLTDDPLVEVPAGSPTRWRAGTLDGYTGRGWVAGVPAGGLPTVVAGAARVDAVQPLRPGITQVLAPGELLAVASPLFAGGVTAVAAGDRTSFAGGSVGSGGYRVRSVSLPSVADPLPALAAAPIGPPNTGADPRYTALPDTVPARVRQLGVALVRSAPDRQAAVRAVEADLGRRMTYDLESPVPPAGTDAVDQAVFVDHRGFCEQFASAEVVLLRAADVPARMAVGFSGGEPGAAGTRTLRRSDAHAWVEVWFPGVGWVESDPTPAGSATEPWWQPAVAAARHLVAVLAHPLSLASLLVAGLLAVLWRRRPDPRPDRPIDAELAAAFARLERRLAAEGRPRAATETVAQLAARLPAPVPGALRVLERALYAPAPPGPAECAGAVATLDAYVRS